MTTVRRYSWINFCAAASCYEMMEVMVQEDNRRPGCLRLESFAGRMTARGDMQTTSACSAMLSL